MKSKQKFTTCTELTPLLDFMRTSSGDVFYIMENFLSGDVFTIKLSIKVSCEVCLKYSCKIFSLESAFQVFLMESFDS